MCKTRPRLRECGEISLLLSSLSPPAPLVRLDTMAQIETRLFINGEYCSPASPAASFKLSNPATEEFLAEIPIAARTDVDRAVECAEKAQPAWAAAAPAVRMAALHKWADLSQSRPFSAVKTGVLCGGYGRVILGMWRVWRDS